MATLSPSETCRRVADIIDFESERFDIGYWEQEDICGTTACIAGHTALLHQDGMADHPTMTEEIMESVRTFKPGLGWRIRQAERLGLTDEAGSEMFFQDSELWSKHKPKRKDIRYSKVLRQLEKELADRDSSEGLIDVAELEQIAEEALQ